MVIKLANLNDAKELAYLKKDIWENTYRGIYDDSAIDNYDYIAREEKFKKLINDYNQEVYICLIEDKIVGYMVLGIPTHESLEGYELTVNDLGVKKEYQRNGIGRQFLELAKSKNKKLFNCCNYYNKKAQQFYEKMGGRIIKTIVEDDKRLSQVYYVYD